MKTAVVYDKWLHQFGGGEMVTCTMAELLLQNGWKVTLVSGKDVTLDRIKEKLDINLSGVQLKTVWNDEGDMKQIVEGKDLFANLSFMDYSYGYAKKNIYYVHFPTPIRNQFFNTTLSFFQQTRVHKLLPVWLKDRIEDRLHAGIFFNMRKRLDSYDFIFANSEFTKNWISRYWGKASEVLYPPVKMLMPSLKKKNWVCSVGRFFTLGHGKKQEHLVKAFKQLYDQGVTDWELHLVGGLGSEPSSLRFMEILKEDAKGYPIHFHINASRNELEHILMESKIYWHAAGYGEDAEKDPIKFEHFGIAPVEAISAGCVPVLYNGGGLPEVLNLIDFKTDKNLFDTVDDLVRITKMLINDEDVPSTDDFRVKIENNFSESHFRKLFSLIIQ